MRDMGLAARRRRRSRRAAAIAHDVPVAPDLLDRDCFTIPDEEMTWIRPVFAIVDGVIVHNTGALDHIESRRRKLGERADPRGRRGRDR